jgi:hypothetical protein
MLLKNWSVANNVAIGRHAHARCVPVGSPNSSKLFHLDDYRVSTVSGGTIWLVLKREWNDAEKRERANIRNLCVGAGSLLQLDYLLKLEGKSDFWCGCVEEYIFELKAEMRDAGEEIFD